MFTKYKEYPLIKLTIFPDVIKSMDKCFNNLIKDKKMYHNVRGKDGKFIPKVSQLVNTNTQRRMINHIGLLLDRSGSMYNCMSRAKKALKNQLSNLQRLAKETGQETYVTVVAFDYFPPELLVKDTNIFNVNINDKIDKLYARDHTELNRSIDYLIDNCNVKLDPNSDESYAVIVITDGGETEKHLLTPQIKNRILSLMNTKSWTFSVNCPRGHRSRIAADYGIPIGNINEWENTIEGTVSMDYTNVLATNSFYTSRSLGATQVDNYFDIDQRKFSSSNLTQLSVCSPKHSKVEKEIGIQDFFITHKKLPYNKGMAYYEITKDEKIQDYKNLVLYNVDNKTYYVNGKQSVRQFLGMPTTGTTKVSPKNVGNFRIFVQSTSDNRKLVRGTTVLWGI